MWYLKQTLEGMAMQDITVDSEVTLGIPYDLNRQLLDMIRIIENPVQKVSQKTEFMPLRALFVGNDDAMKQAAVKVLGDGFAGDICTVDASSLVGSGTGETVKNLGAVLDDAERRGAMLFFDEADALFGKRSAATSAIPACIEVMDRCSAPIVAYVTGYYQLDLDVVKRFSCVIDFYSAETVAVEHA